MREVVHALRERRRGRVTMQSYAAECISRCVRYDRATLGLQEHSDSTPIVASLDETSLEEPDTPPKDSREDSP